MTIIPQDMLNQLMKMGAVMPCLSVCLSKQEQHGVINPFFVDFTICSL